MRQVMALVFGVVTLGSVVAQDRPNIVMILADDLGWADLGCYGADLHETPSLDRLASEGARFSQAYAMPVCSPSRAALMTGRHAARLQMTIWSEGSLNGPTDRKLLQAESMHSLPHREITMATHLQAAGYMTALVGKWHLGDADHYPETHGFDVNIGGTHWGAPRSFWWPYRGRGRFGQEYRYVPHLEFGQPGEYLTDRLTDEALNVIDRAGEQPFFLFLAHHAPHTPIEAKEESIAYFESKRNPELKHQHAVYASMVKSLDESVGRVLDRLSARGLTERTIVIFASDNGGYIGIDSRSDKTVPVTNNAPLRSGKGSCYEGGIRVPMIVRWPQVTTPASVIAEPVVMMDWFPTLMRAAGIPVPSEIPLDGVDLLDRLAGKVSALPHRELFFHYPHYYDTTTPVSAIRSADWKLLEYLEDDRVELYHLAQDVGETANVAKENPILVNGLRRQLHTWRASINAAMPRPNPSPSRN